MKIHIGHFNPAKMVHEITIYENRFIDGRETVSYLTDATMTTVVPGGGSMPPITPLGMEPEEVQALVDVLWNQGLRPTRGFEEGILREAGDHIETLHKHTDRLSGWLDKFIIGSKES